MYRIFLLALVALPACTAETPEAVSVVTDEERAAVVAKLMELQGVIDKQAEELNKARDVAQICWSTFPHSAR